MGKNKPVSFKDNISRMFLRYAMAPAFSIAFAGVLIIFGLWGYSTIDMTRKANENVGQEIAAVIGSYEDALIAMAKQSDLVSKVIDSATRVKVFEDIYRLSNHLGYKTKLYLFDENRYPVLASTKEVPANLRGTTANWGIFRQMNDRADIMVIKIVQDTENQNAGMYMGKTMKEGARTVGYAVFAIDSQEFDVLLTKVPAQIIVTDSLGWIYLANNYDFCDNLKRMSREYETRNGYIHSNNKDFYMTSSGILENQLLIHTVSDVSSQFAAFKWVGLLLAVMFVIILISLIKGADRVSAESTKDIDIIAGAFEQVKEGNLDNYISIYSSKEFRSIGESYNLMIDSLKDQIAKNKEMFTHMAFAQIKQLESQINPHFLFNTLENIRVMCKIDPPQADKMIISLSSLLRYSISNTEEDVTVRQDMEITQSYLSILKIRFNRRFSYTLAIDEETLDMVIPKLLIQPLIENAIKYGFGDRELLTVEVRGYREGDNLIFICRDDGIGIDEETLREFKDTLTQTKNDSGHLGIYNVHKRIHLKYNGDYGITIASKAGEGTTLTLTLPARVKSDSNLYR